MKKSIIMKVYGRVQGVGFRYFVSENARLLKVSGFVKNQYDGSVYIEAEADDAILEIFKTTIKQGNSSSRIEKIQIQNQPIQNFIKFETKY